ncbi:hypothetical protein J416_05673 [Gracilibacillus halophilus YIM-C55.5]|uniref:Endolytic transglycosylase MltG n=1 Tax=Gracilibacillus halophilus YIM-C55.5 TaxID=1308866 RepID=N4WSZ6_9BACI|nr:endolytic transglycosylase MltG [Gracilibacillus halophilus]ENH97475.1 hypothetical protein J416_05673 [Gracilibacillus halophilus YIM-C55.5]
MKQIIRAFALGLLTASVIIGSFYYISTSKTQSESSKLSLDEQIHQVEEEGYYVYQEDMETRISDMEATITELEQSSSEDDNQETSEQDHEETNTVALQTIEIETGMTGPEVAEILHENQIIDDPESFSDYLVEENLARFIQIGEFQVHEEMTIEEIASILTTEQTTEDE